MKKRLFVVLVKSCAVFLVMALPSFALPRLAITAGNDFAQFKASGLQRGCKIDVVAATTSAGLSDSSRYQKIYSTIARSNVSVVKIESDLRSTSGKDFFTQVRQICRGQTSLSNKAVLPIGVLASDVLRTSSDVLLSLRAAAIKKFFRLRAVSSIKSTFTQPVDIQFLPGGSAYLFVVEQGGKIFRVTRSTGAKQKIIDLKGKISTGGERGLLGLAFHPQFSSNRYIFVNYTRPVDGNTVIARFTLASSGRAILSSEKQLLVIPQPYRNHNGGGLTFGPDGYLYIALGDGGSANDPQGNGQNRSVLLGKILRIDVNSESRKYLIPNTNPFVDNSSGYKEEIYAYGLRNPWRISFDGDTLWAGDVGQNLLEEINIIRNGGNYGWSIKEGQSCFRAATCDGKGLRDPVFQYGRSLGASVTGGYVSRLKSSPNLEGTYLFGDFVSGRIFALERVLNRWKGVEIENTAHFISSFGRDADGKVYMASYAEGKIYTIQ